MAKYRTSSGQVIEVGDPSLNPELIAGATPVSQATPLGTIAPDLLNTISAVPFTAPQPSSPYPIASLDSTFQLTAPETKAQNVTDELQNLYSSLAGESAFRTTQETTQGIPELQKTQQDLSSRLKALQNEALAIPIQLQTQAEGRGITAGGLAPIEAGVLRNNAVQALGVASLLEASRGNLTLAMDLVDRAVAQKYDPIKEQIAIKQANLDLILKSPEYSLAEKKRAQRQLDIQNANERETQRQEANYQAIQSIAVQVASTGKADNLILESIKNAKDVIEAAKIAAPYLYKTPGIETQVVDVGGRKLLVNTQTGETVKDLGADITGFSSQVIDVGGKKLLVNSKTGDVIKDFGVTDNSPESEQKLAEEVKKQDALDLQTVQSAYTEIEAITKKYGKTPQTITANDLKDITDSDADSIATALARIQKPDISRAGGDPGNALAPTSAAEKIRAFFRAFFGGKEYLPEKIIEGIQTATSLKNQRQDALLSDLDFTF